MKKSFFSIAGGLIAGLILAFIFFDYQTITNEHIGLGGVDRMVKDMDFEFVFNASLLVIGMSIFIYLIWSWVDRKKEEKFLKDYINSRKRNN
ncbi:hypothetical protein QWY16_03525 [Planococcus shenhongbingii]|uniref:hypothetical protein n=1 Tax=Planococcus shenhongbingii TaxID=3058398 RepID=UPI0026234B4F|nr:hypothetical protein [Planococcus sp. N016]WKA59237.1 hypothetical protein QWY16_03525 [Planococcus sp. N016]